MVEDGAAAQQTFFLMKFNGQLVLFFQLNGHTKCLVLLDCPITVFVLFLNKSLIFCTTVHKYLTAL